MIKYRKSSKFGEKLEHKTVVLYNDLSAAHRRKKMKIYNISYFCAYNNTLTKKKLPKK
jgi:hypothetical protein